MNAEISWNAERVSVVMPVRNALPYLDDAIGSILNQTHERFELVIGDDGSTDGSSEVLSSWAQRDRRIRLLERGPGLGPVGSSNWVARAADGNLIARMDADDIAHPDRLKRQVAAFKANEDAVLVGSLFEGIDGAGRRIRPRTRSSLSNSIFAPPFCHGSIMFRREAFERIGGYRPECEFWEDLDFYIRMSRIGRLLLIPEALYQYRYAETSTRLTSRQERVERAVDLMARCREQVAKGGDYEELLRWSSAEAPRGRLSAETFVSIGSNRILAGNRPRMIGRLLRRGRLELNVKTMMGLVFLIWGTFSPRTLRRVLNNRIAAEDRRLAQRFPDGGVYEWRCSSEGTAELTALPVRSASQGEMTPSTS